MPTSWGKGYLNPSLSISVCLAERIVRGSCSLHLSKQAAILEPGQLDLLEFYKKWDTKADCVRHPTVTRHSIIFISNTGSWEFGLTPLSLALGSRFEHIHFVHQGCIFSEERVNLFPPPPSTSQFPFSIEFLKSTCLEKAALNTKSQAWYSRKDCSGGLSWPSSLLPLWASVCRL